jgi:hypothetical protein
MLWRAPYRPEQSYFVLPFCWAVGSGYSFLVLGLLRAFAVLWAIHCYPCPKRSCQNLGFGLLLQILINPWHISVETNSQIIYLCFLLMFSYPLLPSFSRLSPGKDRGSLAHRDADPEPFREDADRGLAPIA